MAPHLHTEKKENQEGLGFLEGYPRKKENHFSNCTHSLHPSSCQPKLINTCQQDKVVTTFEKLLAIPDFYPQVN